MRFTTEFDAITYVFDSLARSDWRGRGLDEDTRDLIPTQRLLAANSLPSKKREYALVTGSKGKGSITAITAKLLQSLGHKTGMLTSPHLTTYRQRFRINGHMISEADLLRLIDDLSPSIDAIVSSLSAGKYLSPQGIFLALALKWFDENDVTAAVIEVGRGGRYDDNALVPNMLSLFGPIILEHTRYLGPTLERIAWHKAGIIKPQSYAYSLPQSPAVMDMLRAEAEKQGAQFEWLAAMDSGRYIGPAGDGIRASFGRYGEVTLPVLGRYEIDNAALAIWAAGNMHARLATDPLIPHGSDAYVARIRAGLERIIWPGRCQKMQEAPVVYVDGAINPLSARAFIDSVHDRLRRPVISVLAVPVDRDFDAVCSLFAPISEAIILTQSPRNITITFPDKDSALAAARRHHQDVTHTASVREALDAAISRAGQDGTVLMSIAQPAVGDVMEIYGLTYEQI